MSETRSESTVLNGPAGEVTMAFKQPQETHQDMVRVLLDAPVKSRVGTEVKKLQMVL